MKICLKCELPMAPRKGSGNRGKYHKECSPYLDRKIGRDRKTVVGVIKWDDSYLRGKR